jgi:hypothetical protein
MDDRPVAPPLLVYLPGIMVRPSNTARRVAGILADTASEGPGTFAVEALASPYQGLCDGGRIIGHGGNIVLDVLELDYRPDLLRSGSSGSGLGAQVHRFLLSLVYVIQAAALVLRALRRHAKTRVSKFQIFVGFLAMAALLLSFLVTAVAILTALGLVGEPVVSERFTDAVALGLTSVATWLYLRVRPAILRMASLVEQLMDFVHDDRREGTVARKLSVAIDEVLHTDGERDVYILGYSLGSLVAIAFLLPRELLHIKPDVRHSAVLRHLFTVGCPIDFVRLYVPDYLANRTERVSDFKWTNIFIAADIMGSNFRDGNDTDSGPPSKGAIPETVRLRLESRRYTSEKLTWHNVVGRRGFLAHSGYWNDVGEESCLRLLLAELPGLHPAATPSQ